MDLAVAEIAESLGRSVWAWNYCHAAFARIFGFILHRDNGNPGLAMWHTLQSDTAQRNLLIAAASESLPKKSKALAAIIWASRMAEILSTIRNDAVHVSSTFTTHLPRRRLVIDKMTTSPKRGSRLDGKDLNQTHTLLFGDLVALGGYVNALLFEIVAPGQRPLPRKPSLRSIPKSHRVSRKVRRRRDRPKQQRPPASSQA